PQWAHPCVAPSGCASTITPTPAATPWTCRRARRGCTSCPSAPATSAVTTYRPARRWRASMTPISTDAVRWPAWALEREPTELGRYIVREVVAGHARIPERAAGSPLARLRLLWQAICAAGITYAREPAGGGPDWQWIRPPNEVLAIPGNGTCLDIALVL